MSKILYSISDAFKELNSLKESEQFELRNDKEVEKLADFLEDEEISEPIEQIVDIKYQVSSFYDNREQIYIFSAMIIFRI